jgi:hypothetical protein
MNDVAGVICIVAVIVWQRQKARGNRAMPSVPS